MLSRRASLLQTNWSRESPASEGGLEPQLKQGGGASRLSQQPMPCHRTVRSSSLTQPCLKPSYHGTLERTDLFLKYMLRSFAARVCHKPTRLVASAKGFTAQASSATSDQYRDQGGKDNPLLDLDGLDDDTEITEDQKNRQLLEEISSDITDSLQVCAPRQELPSAVS